MTVQIREYLPTDEPALRAAIAGLHDHVVALDPIHRLRREPGYAAHETKNTLTVVAEQHGRILVAEDDGRFVGFIAGFTTTQTAENLLSVVPTRLGVISDLYVHPDYRGHQLGGRLMAEMEAYLAGEGCDSIWITVFAPNTGAHRFYQAHGYTDREVGLIKIL